MKGLTLGKAMLGAALALGAAACGPSDVAARKTCEAKAAKFRQQYSVVMGLAQIGPLSRLDRETQKVECRCLRASDVSLDDKDGCNGY